MPWTSIAISPSSRCQLAHNNFDTESWPGCSSSMVASAYERIARSPAHDRVSRSRISGSSAAPVFLATSTRLECSRA